MSLDNIDTEALRELEAKATPGPWTSSYYGDEQFVVTMPRDRSLRFHRRPPSGCDSQSATVYGAPGIAKDLPGDVIVGMSGCELDGLTEQEYANQRVADGQLIVALRNAAPALLAAVEAQRKEIGHRDERIVKLSQRVSYYESALCFTPPRPWSLPPDGVVTGSIETERVGDVLAERDALKAEVAQAYANAAHHADRAQTLSSKLSASEAEVERLREALTPSGATKAAYHGAFKFTIDGEYERLNVQVPWTTIKEIMAAITKRAALRGEEAGRDS